MFSLPSVFDAVSMETDEGVVQQEENEQISAVSEEKALSDSEIKVPCNWFRGIFVQPQLKFLPRCFSFISYDTIKKHAAELYTQTVDLPPEFFVLVINRKCCYFGDD